MAKRIPKTKEERRIQKEHKRLLVIFGEIPQNKLDLCDGLIRRAAFMRVALEDFETDILQYGTVERFTQSSKMEPYERERPVARLYNSMNKNYQSIMKQLTDALPLPLPEPEEPESESDEREINDFIEATDDEDMAGGVPQGD